MGATDGIEVGLSEGLIVEGWALGLCEGSTVGENEGSKLGIALGS